MMAFQASFRASVDIVSVDVEVTRRDLPVTSLTSADFALTDNGVPQNVTATPVDGVPVDVTLVLDTSDSAADALSHLRTDVQRIASLLRPIDRIRLITFDRSVREIFPLQPLSPRLPVDRMGTAIGTSLNDAVLYAVARAPQPERRQLIVVFTDGEDTISALDDPTVPQVASRGEAELCAVFFKPRGGDHPPFASRSALADAVAQTGGVVVELDDAIAGFRRIFGEFKQGYVLRYTLTGVNRQGWHDLAVSLRGAAAALDVVRARRGYFGAN